MKPGAFTVAVAFATLAALAVSGTALADAVDPSPTNCPNGTVGGTCHGGTYCSPSRCASDAECEANETCEERSVCIGSIDCTGGGPPSSDITAEGFCDNGGACDVGSTCQMEMLCVRNGLFGGGGCRCSVVGTASDLSGERHGRTGSSGNTNGALGAAALLALTGIVLAWRMRPSRQR